MSRLLARMILVALILACTLPPECCNHHDRPVPRMKQRARKRCAAAVLPIPVGSLSTLPVVINAEAVLVPASS